MPRIGYARVSSTGQSLEVQLEKLNQLKCDRIYQEKRSGRTADRPEFQSCMNYLREGDTLIITRLDRLARSVVHLAQLAKRFQSEGIDLLVVDQNIDTSTSTGRLMFNMLAAIAEFENDLRTERQAEGIAKAKENGVKFGRPPKLTESRKQEIYSRRMAGAAIGQLAKEFGLGEASIYRAINAVKKSGTPPELKTTKVILWLQVE
ncbi:MAG: recombinase family protein, partial [Candidatus Thiodiazotropha sp.]